ncbi:MAG: LacI family DNA-binding transcriptional regulator [Anaerolineales bacterium]|nr:LacI family DNA-binding transcriptional regulator [Anaerolineales bacterium]
MLIEEVAKLSGVSRSTVSRVINNDPHVKESTRARVLEVIRQVNFRPNAVARGLASGRTRIIGLIFPTAQSSLFTDPYYPGLVQGITAACNASDYSVMLWLASQEQERSKINQVASNSILDGVIIASYLIDDPILESLTKSKVPFLLIGRHPSKSDLNYIDSDNMRGAREAVVYLLQLGRRRIATITGPKNMIAGIDRQEGYERAFRERGLTPDPELVVEGDFTESGGYNAMMRLIPRTPDAVFVASDAMALGALRALNEAGQRVPEDVALVGFDDLPSAAHLDPPLTTVRQNIQRMGQLAAETLIQIIAEGAAPPHRLVLPTELVIRASTG